MREGSKRLTAVLAALLLAVGLAACGGDDGSTESTGADAGAKTQAEGKPDGSKQTGKKDGDAGKKPAGEGQADGPGAGSAAGFVPKQHDDSGGGSQQYKVKGGDNSVQEFGEEADSADFDAAAAALHNFLDARAEGNWEAACAYMSKTMIESFEKLAAQAKIEASSCGTVLEKLTNPAAKQVMKAEAAKANVGSLRTEGDRSFVIYTGVDDTILAMPMANENGVWKVSSLTGTPLN